MSRSVYLINALFLLTIPVMCCGQSPIDDDESVILFRTTASRIEGTDQWRIPIHGWIFEPEMDSKSRSMLLTSLARGLGLSESSAESSIFHDRARAFIVDNERGQDVTVRVGPLEIHADESEENGHFKGEIEATEQSVRSLLEGSTNGWVSSSAMTKLDDPRRLDGAIQFVEPDGVSVISDIDDTIKISDVRNRRALLENTFLRQFSPAPGMPGLYRRWLRSGAVFHYVTSSPWQLYRPLTEFMEEAGLPAGSMHMKRFRFKDSDFLNLFEGAEKSKPLLIEDILERFPQRRFVLVGDSGEADPEVYGEIARQHPEQVRLILIRNVTDESPDAERFGEAFRDLPADRWRLFTDAARLAEVDLTEL